jgi:hypothetical protein
LYLRGRRGSTIQCYDLRASAEDDSADIAAAAPKSGTVAPASSAPAPRDLAAMLKGMSSALQSDRDAAVADRVARESGVPGYPDNRHLLAEARPRAVYLAVPPTAAS